MKQNANRESGFKLRVFDRRYEGVDLIGQIVARLRSFVASITSRRRPDERKDVEPSGFARSKENIAAFREIYATPADFCRLFHTEMESLYLLVLLLTGNQSDAERCFVKATQQLTETTSVFKEWAAAWIRRCLIKNAIAVVFSKSYHGRDRSSRAELQESKLDAMVHAVTRLEPLQRFVFVMTVLEGYSVRECSLLLDCAVEKVNISRVQALRQLALPQLIQEAVNPRSLAGVALLPQKVYPSIPFIPTVPPSALTLGGEIDHGNHTHLAGTR